MEEGKIVVTPEEKDLRRQIEDLFLSSTVVDFVGVVGETGEETPEGKLVIFLGTPRPLLLSDLLGTFLPKVQGMLQKRSFRLAIVKGRTRMEAKE